MAALPSTESLSESGFPKGADSEAAAGTQGVDGGSVAASAGREAGAGLPDRHSVGQDGREKLPPLQHDSTDSMEEGATSRLTTQRTITSLSALTSRPDASSRLPTTSRQTTTRTGRSTSTAGAGNLMKLAVRAKRQKKNVIDPSKFSRTFRNGLKRAQRNRFPRINLSKAEMDDEAAELLAQVIANADMVDSLVLQVNEIGDAGVLSLATVLQSNAQLTQLDLSDNNFGDEGCHAICEMLKMNDAVIDLDVAKNHIEANGFKELANTVVRHNKSLRRLVVGKFVFPVHDIVGINHASALAFSRTDFSREDLLWLTYALQEAAEVGQLSSLEAIDVAMNKIPAAEILYMVATLGVHCKCIRSYDVKGNIMGPSSAARLAHALARLPHIERIVVGTWPLAVQELTGVEGVAPEELSFEFPAMVPRKGEARKLDVVDIAFIAAAMQTNTVSTTLRIWNDPLGDEAAAWIAKLVGSSPHIRQLRYSKTEVGATGAIAISEKLNLQHLEALDLSQNPIHIAGCKALAEALKTNSVLTSLDLSECGVLDRGAMALCEALRKNSTLESLVLVRNSLTDGCLGTMSETMVLNETLKRLDLSRNGLTADGVTEMANVLLFNTSLTSLQFAKCGVGNEGAEAFGMALRRNRSLLELDLSHSQMDWRGVKHLFEAMRRNRVLGQLRIDGIQVDDKLEYKLESILSANRNFKGEYTRKGELLHGTRYFRNGDRLVCSKGGRHGFSATGTYIMEEKVAGHVATTVKYCVIAGIVDSVLSLLLLDRLGQIDSNETPEAPFVYLALLGVLLLSQSITVINLLVDARLGAAAWALIGLSYVKDAVDVLFFSKIEGVTVDVRSDDPVFGLASIVRSLLQQAMFRSIPVAGMSFLVALTGRYENAGLYWICGISGVGMAGMATALRDHQALEHERAVAGTDRAKKASFEQRNLHTIDDAMSLIVFTSWSIFRCTECLIRVLLPGLLIFGGAPPVAWILWFCFGCGTTWAYFGIPSGWGQAPCRMYKAYMKRRSERRRGVASSSARHVKRFKTGRARAKQIWRSLLSFIDASVLVGFSLVFFPGHQWVTPKFWLHRRVHLDTKSFLLMRTVEESGALAALYFLYNPEQTRREINNYPPMLTLITWYMVAFRVFMFIATTLLAFWLGAPTRSPYDDEDDFDVEQALWDTDMVVGPSPAKLGTRPVLADDDAAAKRQPADE